MNSAKRGQGLYKLISSFYTSLLLNLKGHTIALNTWLEMGGSSFSRSHTVQFYAALKRKWSSTVETDVNPTPGSLSCRRGDTANCRLCLQHHYKPIFPSWFTVQDSSVHNDVNHSHKNLCSFLFSYLNRHPNVFYIWHTHRCTLSAPAR